MATAVVIRRGDTFQVQGAVAVDGVAQDLTGWAIEAQILRGALKIADLEVQVISAASGTFQLRENVTDGWPVGDLTLEIRYVLPSGDVVSAPSAPVQVRQGVY